MKCNPFDNFVLASGTRLRLTFKGLRAVIPGLSLIRVIGTGLEDVLKKDL